GTLNVGDEDLQDEFARSFPRLFQTLSELPSMTSGWYDVPGVEAMTRFDASTPVRTMPDVRDYLRDDLMASVEHEQRRFRYLAAWGGIGYIPYLLLVAGIVAIAFGLFEVRRAASSPPGRPAWAGVVAIGFVILLAIAGLQYFPRLNGADTMISRLRPAFEQPRVEGLRAGTDLVVQSALFGDPIMTRAGGAAAEYPELVATVAERSGQSHSRVRRGLRGAAPRTAALLEALPLSSAAREVPHLLAVLARRMHTDDRRLVRTLRRRTPALTRSILALGPVTAGWNAMPGTADLERFDGVTPVRAVPAFGDYLDRDVVPILEGQHEHFDKLANTWPPVRVLPGLLLASSVLAVLYGVAMMFRATKP
ncbi:MAG: hypothetical protein QOG56_1078, partial [Solirubrobacteraceae bacterium]|nr:hypothetical protein [Solirubrobacteraceae bacterium]